MKSLTLHTLLQCICPSCSHLRHAEPGLLRGWPFDLEWSSIGSLVTSKSIPGAERVTALRVLGVVISSRLTMGDHLDQLLSSCASSIFALRTLKSHGLRPLLLHQVARATTVASLL